LIDRQHDSTEDVPTPHELPNKPLVEAIFELRWQLSPQQGGLVHIDPGFQIFLGRFYDKVQTNFPAIINLPTAQIPEEMVSYAVRHQFRPAPNNWPLVQVGPGIITVNETHGYTSSSFKNLVGRTVSALFEAYPTNLAELRPINLSLRYMNAVSYLDSNPSEVINFLQSHLHTGIEVDSKLYEGDIVGNADQINLTLNFPVRKHGAQLSLGFASGTSKGEDALIWQLAMATADTVPQTLDQIVEWVKTAHRLIEQWFFTLSRGKLYSIFSAGGQHD
jgi:uncharacterized protein (TIGR04255 family)